LDQQFCGSENGTTLVATASRALLRFLFLKFCDRLLIFLLIYLNSLIMRIYSHVNFARLILPIRQTAAQLGCAEIIIVLDIRTSMI